MNATADRLEFAPPATPGLLRAFALAMLAHGLLVVALTLSVQWRRDAQIISAEAELWSAIPQAVAPKLQEAPEPPPVVQPKVPPAPKELDQPTQAEIALEREKRRIEKQKQLELDQREKAKQAKLKEDKLKADKLKADQAKQAEAAKQLALEKKKAALEEKQLQAQRDKNLARIAGLANATGSPSATGTATVATGPSASYGGRIRARIKPNIVFTEEVVGNPNATVEVRTAPDGTIVGRKLLKSSGDKGWDEAVLKAIDKTEVLPRDTDGRVPPLLEISFKPKD
ncbi:MAG: cell envelope integrity protein TolA [Rhodoferax sp.]|nr:cell envelope integrity protein TolA [Rhodoferax sp.]